MSKRKLTAQSNGQPKKKQRTSNYGSNSRTPTVQSRYILSPDTHKPNFSADVDSERIGRPVSSTGFDCSQPLQFQQIDTDDYIGWDPLQRSRSDNREKQAVIRLYGVTEAGQSVCCHATNFAPYFYCNPPTGFVQGRDEGAFQKILNEQVMMRDNNRNKCHQYITKVLSVEKQSMWGYHFGKRNLVLKIFTYLPTLIAAARRVIIEGFRWQTGTFLSETFESNMAFILRYMIDRKIVGAGWIGVTAGQYSMVPSNRKSSTCDIEVVARCNHINGIESMDQVAPLRVLSFDIECMCASNGGFPEASDAASQVIQISNVCYIQGSDQEDDSSTTQTPAEGESTSVSPNAPKDKYFHQNVFCLGSCSPIAGAHVYCYATERELLSAWSQFVNRLDPDILTGYNIVNFDIPYLIERASFLKLDSFCILGRQKTMKSIIKESSFSSKAYGSSKSKDINIPGRVQMDLLPIMRRDHKLRSYTLNSVSFHFLKSQKEDVHYSIIGDLQRGTSETRRRLAVYCLKDSVLPLKLIEKLQTTINLIEMARVTGVPINFLITRGQQIKVLSQLYRTVKPKGIIIPFRPYNREQNANKAEGVGFEGATVIEPKRGYYKDPIVTLDFASLYPSIMIAHNLCYTTMIAKQDLGTLDEKEYTKSPNGGYFIKPDKQKGILPEILQNLLSERKRVKKLMKGLAKEGKKDSMLYAVYNGRQLALKISANSVYGFTGATVGALPCLTISAAVTGFGRDMIHDTKEFIEKHYCVESGFVSNADVVYGDTDSVMIKFGDNATIPMAKAMELGEAAAQLVTERLFIKPIMLEFEKVYQPYLLMNKKRYAGMLWTNPNKWDYMDAKGIETVRRDNCPLTKNVVQSVLDYVLIDGDEEKAVEYTKNVISRLLQNKIDLSSLIITKKLNKIEDYKVKAAHVELVKRMRKRSDSLCYKSGDRVSYVIIKGNKGAKAYEKAEDPLYALENCLSMDTKYYLINQLQQPLTRIFEPILGDKGVGRLFHGDHTRSVKITTSTAGAMARFVVQRKTCIGCKCMIKKGIEGNVCGKCKAKESQLYMKQIAVVRNKERVFHKLWTQCQRCQGSLTQEVLCSNRDCPIFYKRTKVRKDLEEAQKLLQKFAL